MDEIRYKNWRIEVLTDQPGRKALVYRPTSPLHETTVPHGLDRDAVVAEAVALIDRNEGA